MHRGWDPLVIPTESSFAFRANQIPLFIFGARRKYFCLLCSGFEARGYSRIKYTCPNEKDDKLSAAMELTATAGGTTPAGDRQTSFRVGSTRHERQLVKTEDVKRKGAPPESH